jgi:hypothetical protein
VSSIASPGTARSRSASASGASSSREKKIDAFREEHPLPQGQLDLGDEYLSRHAHLERVKREVFCER